jgi:hypothetical protein
MKIHELDNETITSNIKDMYVSAIRAEQLHAGDWYRSAKRECEVIARSLGIPFETFVGVVAALSPQMNWKYNVREAVKLCKGQQALGYGRNIVKAKVILGGAPPLDVLGGNKVRSFYRNLCDGGEDDSHVTVDTWAARIATGNYSEAVSITDKQYKRLVSAYQSVADDFGVKATELQAITWVHVRTIVNMKITHTQLGLPL